MIEFTMTEHSHGRVNLLGAIPFFLSKADPRPAAAQFHERYAHGGGWMPMKGWKHVGDFAVKYCGDPVYRPIATARLRNETIAVYQHAWVAVFQTNGTFEISRMD